MGKRSNFARYPLDKHDTPFKAVLPLLKHLPFDTKFIEPFAGNNVLVKHLEAQGHTCLFASDIEPGADGISTVDLFSNRFMKMVQLLRTHLGVEIYSIHLSKRSFQKIE